MKPTDINNPEYFHKVVDCQWACPAHTPVPEYIRLIADKRYTSHITDCLWFNFNYNFFVLLCFSNSFVEVFNMNIRHPE